MKETTGLGCTRAPRSSAYRGPARTPNTAFLYATAAGEIAWDSAGGAPFTNAIVGALDGGKRVSLDSLGNAAVDAAMRAKDGFLPERSDHMLGTWHVRWE